LSKAGSGRKGALIAGLAIYTAASAASAFVHESNMLVFWRAVAGIGAAVVYPTTLSLISNVFRTAGRRAKAIGMWGAGLGRRGRGWADRRGRAAAEFGLGRLVPVCAGCGALTLVLAAPVGADQP